MDNANMTKRQKANNHQEDNRNMATTGDNNREIDQHESVLREQNNSHLITTSNSGIKRKRISQQKDKGNFNLREQNEDGVVSIDGKRQVLDMYFNTLQHEDITSLKQYDAGMLWCVHWKCHYPYMSTMKMLSEGLVDDEFFDQTFGEKGNVEEIIQAYLAIFGLRQSKVTSVHLFTLERFHEGELPMRIAVRNLQELFTNSYIEENQRFSKHYLSIRTSKCKYNSSQRGVKSRSGKKKSSLKDKVEDQQKEFRSLDLKVISDPSYELFKHLLYETESLDKVTDTSLMGKLDAMNTICTKLYMLSIQGKLLLGSVSVENDGNEREQLQEEHSYRKEKFTHSESKEKHYVKPQQFAEEIHRKSGEVSGMTEEEPHGGGDSRLSKLPVAKVESDLKISIMESSDVSRGDTEHSNGEDSEESKTGTVVAFSIHRPGILDETTYPGVKEMVASLLGGLEDAAMKHGFSGSAGLVIPHQAGVVLKHLPKCFVSITEAFAIINKLGVLHHRKALVSSLAILTKDGVCTYRSITLPPRLILLTGEVSEEQILVSEKERLPATMWGLESSDVEMILFCPVILIPISDRDDALKLSETNNGGNFHSMCSSNYLMYKTIEQAKLYLLAQMHGTSLDPEPDEFSAEFILAASELRLSAEEKEMEAKCLASDKIYQELKVKDHFDSNLLHYGRLFLWSFDEMDSDERKGDTDSRLTGVDRDHDGDANRRQKI